MRRVTGRLRAVRWSRVLAWGALALVVSFVLGVTTASTEQSLGPHEARYAVTTDDLVTLDLGPLGTVEIESPLPLTLGARVTVQEIPAGVTSVDPAGTIQVLSEDLQGYVQFFTGPQATIEDAARALVLDAVQRTLLAFVALVTAGWLLGALLGAGRRREIAAALAPHGRQLTGGVVVVAVVAVTCVSSLGATARDGGGRLASSVFDGTALEGARMTGRLAGVIDTYGSVVVDAYRQNEAFYAAADEAVAAAWDRRALESALIRPASADDDAPAPAAPAPAGDGDATAGGDVAGEGGTGDGGTGDGGTGDGGTGDGGTGDGGARDGAGAGAGGSGNDEEGDSGSADESDDDEPTEPVDPVVLVLVSDLHCNVGMARIIGTVVERSGADVVLNAGDTTVNGTTVERYCVTTFGQAVPGGIPRVVADGNHDSLETADHERAAGWTVLDGGVVTAAGVRILGDRDPSQTQIGRGTAQVSDETAAEAGERLAEVACREGDVDILLIHTPRVGDAAMRSGCVPVQLSGHQHRRSGPLTVDRGVRYVSASTAGATSGQATVGPLNGVAELTVLRFDPERRRMLDHQLVTVAPDGSATVGPRLPFPVADPAGDEDADGDGDGDDAGQDAGRDADGDAARSDEPPVTG